MNVCFRGRDNMVGLPTPTDEMQRDIEVHAEASRIEVAFQGPVSFLDRIHALDAVAPELIRRALTRVLIDYTHAWVDEASVEAFEALETRIRSEASLRGLKVALVNPPEFHAVPTEEIAPESGFQVRRFNSRAAAIAWLDRGLKLR
jgi:hypothetical protein